MTTTALPEGVPEDCDELIRIAVEYWLSIHPENGLPGRQHLDPLHIPKLLPYVRLVDVVGDPPRFRVRLMGSCVVDFYNEDLTGTWYDEAFPLFRGSEAEKTILKAINCRKPQFREGPPSYFKPKDHQRVQRITLPLARDGQNVDMLFVVHSYRGIC